MKSQMLVNNTLSRHLEEIEVQKIPIEEGKKQFELVNKGDVVILPVNGSNSETSTIGLLVQP